MRRNGAMVMGATKPRLRFRREAYETGLASIGQGPRGFELWYGDERLGSADEIRTGPGMALGSGRFFWSVGTFKELGIEHRNTAATPVDSMEAAKSMLRAYVVRCLKDAYLR